LSGLDDIRVLKGCDNFQALRDMAKSICEPNKIDPIVEAIDEAELYYQTDYVHHLQEQGSHSAIV
jgi:hypothetical protein